jgi:hypothetical protein
MSIIKPCRQCGAVAEHYQSIPTCCKECWRARVTARRIAKIDQVRLYDRERSKLPHRRLARAILARRPDQILLKKEYANKPENRTKAVAINRRKRETMPGYKAAHTAVACGIRNGSLIRPSRCSRCGGKGKIHAHHDDHEKHLDVLWLCPMCHTHRHQEIGKMKIASHGILYKENVTT